MKAIIELNQREILEAVTQYARGHGFAVSRGRLEVIANVDHRGDPCGHVVSAVLDVESANPVDANAGNAKAQG